MSILIGFHLAGGDNARSSLFLEYAADRIPVSEKIKLLRRAVDDRYEASGHGYPELYDDIRVVNDVRVLVAHSSISFDSANTPFFWKIRRGKPSAVEAVDLSKQCQDAKQRGARATRALTGMVFWFVPVDQVPQPE